MDEFLYASEYYCDNKSCLCYHPVSVWLEEKTGKYYVTDSDGDEIAKYSDWDSLLKDYPEGQSHSTPKEKKIKNEKWFALINPDTSHIEVVSVKKGGRWDKNWRDALYPKDAPEIVRLVLGLSDTDKENNTIIGIDTWEDFLMALKNLDRGKRYKNTCVISFYVKVETD